MYCIWQQGRHTRLCASACADPESYVRAGPNLITFFVVDEGVDGPITTINEPSSARQRNAI